ncbi:MAG: NADH-quinone oxidoreductase subunit G [Planctomycetota bacterium]|jgi:NADH-quinone oxidoreductase subunit G
MPTITINGQVCPFEPGQLILQIALENNIAIPHYCYHPGLSVVANCRICLAEVWAPNPRHDNRLEPIPKLLPACQTPAGDGQVVHTDSPKAIANQRAVMEYLLINHPVDCPVCDQAGECYLQDYAYQYGRGVSRFGEQKIKQPKKDLGPNVLLYMDRCIMCTRCVRFCREVTGTNEITVEGRGAQSQIDVFPGMALDNELSANVIDLCPVGALLDKDFLFQQRVWFLAKTPSIDGITCSGDNIFIEHNKGQVYRIKPRTNHEVNKWWITDEVRYGWKFVHDENRLTLPAVRGEEPYEATEALLAYESAYARANDALRQAEHIGVMISPMLSCEDAYLLARFVLEHDAQATLAVGPVPVRGRDRTFPGGFTMYAEKAPNARGVRRVLENFSANVLDYDALVGRLRTDSETSALVLTGNYPSDWVIDELVAAIDSADRRFVLLIDTLSTKLSDRADVVIPAATWAEKSGTFENVGHRLQAFKRAIEPIDFCKSEAQIALDLVAASAGETPAVYDPDATRQMMADIHGLKTFITEVHLPGAPEKVESDMEVVEL